MTGGLILGRQSEGAIRQAMRQGMPVWDRPEYEFPRVPSDLTAVDDEDLMLLYSVLTAWADFASTQVSCAQVDERAASNELSQKESMLMAALKGNGAAKDRVTYTKAQVAADDSIAALKAEVEERHAYRKVVESLLNNIERDSALVSRELTRRTASRNRTPTSRWSP